MTSNRSVLLVEDEPRVADFIMRGLAAEGWTVAHEVRGADGLARAAKGALAVAILDVMLPDMSGFDLCRALRAQGSAVPVLMLTALDSVEDRVKGLRLGADDYLGKPFAFDELIARVEALARRSAPTATGNVLAVGDLVLDRDSLVVTRAGRALELTSKEFAVLEFMMGAVGRLISREELLSAVWGANEDPFTNVVDVFISRLRRKLDDRDGQLILTVRRRGYRLVPPA